MKKTTYRLSFLIVYLLMASTSLFAQKDQQFVIDSLSAKAKSETGESKLKTISKLIELEIFSPNLPSILDDLEREAKKQQNERYLLFSYNYRITYYIRNSNTDSIIRYTKLSSPIVKRLDPTDSIVTHNEFLKIIDYTTRGLFDLALLSQKRYFEKIKNIENVAPVSLVSIYIGFGDTYYNQANYEEALKYFNLAKNLQKKSSNPASRISTIYLEALCYIYLKNYPEALQHCDSASMIINDNKEVITENTRAYLGFVADLIGIQAYSRLKDFKKAKELIDQLPAQVDNSFFQEQKDYYYLTLSTYYSSTKQYDTALKYIDLGLDHLIKNNKIITLPEFIQEKASLLYSMQNYKEAYDQLLKVNQFTDSIRNSHSAIQLDELAITYEVDLKDAQIAKADTQLKFTQTIIAALIIISILLLIILLFFRINSKKQQKKNVVLFKQHEELNKSLSYYKKVIIDDISNNTLSINPLFVKLEDYMLEEKAYKIPDISREDIASALNTNRQYLSTAIKDVTGLTFTSYINKYRLEDAKKQLLENDEIRIDDIILESGFSSRPTFHRLFKDLYGMAPHELKRAATTLQNELKEGDK